MAAPQTLSFFFPRLGFIQSFKLRQTKHWQKAEAVSSRSQSQGARGGQALAICFAVSVDR